MDFQEIKAKTVSDAITEASIRFGVPSDRLEFEIVSEGSSGFFGIGRKDAVIRVRVKEERAKNMLLPKRLPLWIHIQVISEARSLTHAEKEINPFPVFI